MEADGKLLVEFVPLMDEKFGESRPFKLLPPLPKLIPITMLVEVQHLSHEKKPGLLLSIESWLFHDGVQRFMVYDIIPTQLHG